MKKEVAITEFKSHCLEILKNLAKTKSPIVITKHNKPIATVLPFYQKKKSIFGSLQDKAEIKEDIVESTKEFWEAEK